MPFTTLEQYRSFKKNISENYIKNIYCEINNINNTNYGETSNIFSSNSYSDNSIVNSKISNAMSCTCSTSNAKIYSMIG